MKDFLGNDYDVGDRVVYAAMSGRCANMVLAEVVEIKDNGHVRVLPIEGARWSQHGRGRRYIDTRTGKGIDPWRNKAAQKSDERYRNSSGETLTWREYDELTWRERAGWLYVGPQWHDWVQEVEVGPKPVTLQITKNIVKVGAGDGS